MSGPELEAARPLAEPGDTDAVTFAWADAGARLYGLARIGRGVGGDGAPQGSALAVVFSGRAPVGALARGGQPPGDGWERLAVGGLTTTVERPLEAWTASADGEVGFALRFEAAGPPAELPAGSAVAAAGGMAGYEQLCRVEGTVRVDGGERRVRGVGQRSRAWGNPDWDGIALTRAIGIWRPDGGGLALSTVRPADALSHAEEALWATLLEPDGAVPVAEPRLSTTSDGDGRQLRAGLELYVAGDERVPRRASGEALCGSTLDLGALRLDCAFFTWRLDGREGVGRYDLLRRA